MSACRTSNFRFFEFFGAFANTFDQVAKYHHFLQIDPHNQHHGLCGKPLADTAGAAEDQRRGRCEMILASGITQNRP